MSNILISLYIHICKYDNENSIVFNTNGGGICLLDNIHIHNNKLIIDNFSETEIKELYEQGILIDNIESLKSSIINSVSNYNTLSITIELTTACNFYCTYCYQHGWAERKNINDDIISCIFLYIENCLKTNKFLFLEIALIGGEPLMELDRVYSILEHIDNVNSKFDITTSLHIDTNGTLINETLLKKLKKLDINIGFSISITNIDDHNKNRPYIGGGNTYEDIVNKIIKFKEYFIDNFELVLGYNANQNNIVFFEEFIDELVNMDFPCNIVSLQHCQVTSLEKGKKIASACTSCRVQTLAIFFIKLPLTCSKRPYIYHYHLSQYLS